MNKKKKKNKTVFIYIGIIVLLLVGIVVINNLEPDNALYGKPSSELNPATRELLKDENYQNIILPAALDEKVENKEDFIVYMFSSTCIYCKQTTPQIMPIVNELGVEMHQFNVLEFPEYQTKYNVEFTPTLIYFEDGVEKERIVGGVTVEGSNQGSSLEEFRAFFEKYKG
ncbi:MULTISPECIES: thioredoxin family protein [Paenibacillus]|uniref:thioredoxin family protein n=1 Tax=Paenibacillus TaxID=44249 RepID=UPI002041E250|nr:thioredoxin family protein [Paenibacillus camelliae]